MVELYFVGTGIRIFSATVPTPGSYEVYVDGRKLPEKVGSSSRLDSHLLLGSITGLEMAPHTVTLVNSGVTGAILDLDRVEVESVTTDGSYTEQPDAKMNISFEGDGIAIYGTTGTGIENYAVTLDGQSRTFNGESSGSFRTPHDETVPYLANSLGVGRHELMITSNPSSLGGPRTFNVDLVKVFSDSRPVLVPPGLPDGGISSALPPQVLTGSSYTSVISSSVFPPLMARSPSTSPIPSPSLMSPPSTLPAPPRTTNFDSVRRTLSNKFKVPSNKGLVYGVIASAVIAGVGLIFFAIFMWRRKTMNPQSSGDLEKGDGPGKNVPATDCGDESPDLPIQHAEKTFFSPVENDDPFVDFAPHTHTGLVAYQTQGYSRNGSIASSITVNEPAYHSYDSYRETLQKRALLTSSILSTDSTCRHSVSSFGLKDPGHINARVAYGNYAESIASMHSDDSQYSQTSERIFINRARVPPQFSIPARPPFAAIPPRPSRMAPPRPARARDSLALPF